MEKRTILAVHDYFILKDLCSQNFVWDSYILNFNFLNYSNKLDEEITKTKVEDLDEIY